MSRPAQPTPGVAVIPPPRPTLALPPRPALRRGLWALPLLLSLAFVAAVLAWLRSNERADLELQRLELISDALSLESQVSGRVDRESQLLRELAAHLRENPNAALAFAAMPEVQQGLRRFWISLTWLDAANRIVAHLPEQAPVPSLEAAALAQTAGLSAHLAAPLPGGGAIVARYSPTEMLRQNVPWWLTRKYDVRIVGNQGEVTASTTEGRELPGRQSYRISMAPTFSDSYLELIARDQVPKWYRTFPIAMVAGFVLLIAGITWMLRRQVHDVSRAEAAWRTEAAWRSAMEDSLTVGLRARDLDGRLVYVNRALCDMVGLPPEALVGKMPPMPYWPAESTEEFMLRHQRNMAGEAPREGYEARWRHRDGRLLDVRIYEAPLVDARNRHIGWMGSILDITATKRAEERERHQVDTMTHHARLTMLGEVASTLAHELNQPLTAISSYNAGVINSMQRQAAPDPVLLRALQRLGEQAAHAGRIVQRIREFLTRREPQLEPCALNAVVEGGVALLRRELERQRVQLDLRLDPALPLVVADAVLIEQVVINLVRNASDALGDMPGERRIEARTLRTPDHRFVRIDVRDNGPGLQGRPVEALCAAFYSTKREGMGMGLAICRSIVEAHHGALDASDVPGGGACFSLTLPANLVTSAPAVDEEEVA
ncbi:sensor histidine kinase [Methylibium sp.]|uniref:sensor histidine kinase n=1 Tax=Methylibium sp. TaxID=2067992 RepID=UPI003D11855C